MSVLVCIYLLVANSVLYVLIGSQCQKRVPHLHHDEAPSTDDETALLTTVLNSRITVNSSTENVRRSRGEIGSAVGHRPLAPGSNATLAISDGCFVVQVVSLPADLAWGLVLFSNCWLIANNRCSLEAVKFVCF